MSRESRFQIFGDSEPAKVIVLPDTLADYEDLWRDIEKLRDSDPDAWRHAMRLWSAGDLYFLGMFLLSMGQVWDPYWERPRFWCQEHLEFARWVQFDSKGSVLIASRSFGKSTWTTFARNLQTKLQDPNRTSFIFSYIREAAEKHLGRIVQEITDNRELVTVWSDRFHATVDLYKQCNSKAVLLPRTVSRPEATFEAHAFISKLPTGSHPDERWYDDIEEEQSVSSVEAMEKLEAQFTSSQNITSPVRWAMVVGTYYHPNGKMRKLHVEDGWTLKLLPGELLPKDGEAKRTDEGAGPMGGTPYYFHPTELADMLRVMGGRTRPKAVREYTMQIACDPVAGEPNRLARERVMFYDEDPLELAKTGTLYICVDPSLGTKDPTWAWVWRLGVDRRFYWVGGFRKRLLPAARKHALYLLALEFSNLGDLVEMRVEEFGQSDYIGPQKEFHEQRNFDLEIEKCCDNQKAKNDRIWERWQPRLEDARIVFPRHLWSTDENGERIDLVAYFLDFELSQFPKPYTDDGLDAGSLIWESEDKLGELVWPTRQRSERRSEAPEDAGTYMSGGIY